MPKQDYDKIVKLACKPKNAPPKVKVSDGGVRWAVGGKSNGAMLTGSTWSKCRSWAVVIDINIIAGIVTGTGIDANCRPSDRW